MSVSITGLCNDIITKSTIVISKHSYFDYINNTYKGKYGNIFTQETENDLNTHNFSAFDFFASANKFDAHIYFKRKDNHPVGINNEMVGKIYSGSYHQTHCTPLSATINNFNILQNTIPYYYNIVTNKIEKI